MSRLRYAGLTGSIGSGGLTNSATSHTFTAALTYANGVTVPTLSGSDYFLLTILDSSGNLSEVVKVTAYNSATAAATLVRGQEGTSGVSHSSGDKVTIAAYATDFKPRDLRWIVPNAQTSIDEFDDESLDSAWVRVDTDTAANATWTETGDSLSYHQTAASDNTGKGHALMRPLSGIGGSLAVGDGIAAHVSFSMLPVNSNLFGIMFADGVTGGSGNQLNGFVGWDTNTFDTNLAPYTGYNSIGANASGRLALGTNPFFALWMRLARVASTSYRLDLSKDGIDWVPGIVAVTNSTTFTHAGFFGGTFTTTNKFAASVDCVRRMSGIS